MKSLTEKLCATIMTYDFLCFSYEYEKSKENLEKYCLDNFGVDIGSLSLLPTTDNESLESVCYTDAFKQANTYMPFRLYKVSPVYTHFTDVDEQPAQFFSPYELFEQRINYPNNLSEDCSELVKKAITNVKSILLNNHGFETLFVALENYCTYFSVDGGKTSFFEFLKTKAGHASILFHQLMLNEQEHSLLICSFDFLGIKEFKFAERFENNLSLMKTASLYIDIFRESVLDEFLELIGLTRANIVFSGGRHIHMYLPYTSRIEKTINGFIQNLNDWCVENHNTALYVSYGYQKTTFSELKSIKKPTNYYLNLFEKIASIKAMVESAKYSVRNICCINKNNTSFSVARQDQFVNKLTLLEKIFYEGGGTQVIITDDTDGVPVFPGRFISTNDNQNIVRKYVDKTTTSRFWNNEIGIWLMHQKSKADFLSFSNNGHVGVLRIDIDDFRKKMLSYGSQPEKLIPDSEYKMMLSKEFAIFLRFYQYVLAREYASVNVMHEGADDVFFVGEIKELFNFAFSLASAYQRYTNHKMTISAGYTVYKITESFLNAANEAQELMNKSKTVIGKNAITILDSSTTYKWDKAKRFNAEVLLNVK